jgi:hypothetical protein
MQLCLPFRGINYITEEVRDINLSLGYNHRFRLAFGLPTGAVIPPVITYTIPFGTKVRFESIGLSIYTPTRQQRRAGWGLGGNTIGRYDITHLKITVPQPTVPRMKAYDIWIRNVDLQGWRIRPDYPPNSVIEQGLTPTPPW